MRRLIIYSRPPSHIKSFLKKILGVKRGPDTLTSMLIEQLREYETTHPHTYTVIVNPPLHTIKNTDLVHILQNTKDLQHIITLKQKGLQCKLIVGPTMVVHPNEEEGVLLNPCIDAILMPSQWPADFIIHEAPILKHKVYIWPIGCNPKAYMTPNNTHVGLSCIIYDKQYGADKLAGIIQLLKDHHISYTLFRYGSYSHQQYIKTLKQVDFMIYLSQSESQGIALQEAWFSNIPTFVLKSTTWNYGTYSWSNPQINAPYLSPRLGAIFNNTDSLKQLISEGLIQYQPAEEARVTLSSTASNMIYFDILNRL